MSNVSRQEKPQFEVPEYFKNKSTPRISYTYTNLLCTHNLFCKDTMQDINSVDTKSNSIQYYCTSWPYKYNPCGHAVAENLDIVINKKLRTILSRGPKFRKSRSSNWCFLWRGQMLGLKQKTLMLSHFLSDWNRLGLLSMNAYWNYVDQFSSIFIDLCHPIRSTYTDNMLSYQLIKHWTTLFTYASPTTSTAWSMSLAWLILQETLRIHIQPWHRKFFSLTTNLFLRMTWTFLFFIGFLNCAKPLLNSDSDMSQVQPNVLPSCYRRFWRRYTVVKRWFATVLFHHIFQYQSNVDSKKCHGSVGECQVFFA